MMRKGLAGWPLWISVGVHVVGLATASSVVALARHEPERVLVPVEMVRVEPPPAGARAASASARDPEEPGGPLRARSPRP